MWQRAHKDLLCFSFVSYSLFGLIFFWLSSYRKTCVYFPLRSWIPWVPTCFEQQENQKRMNSEYSEKTNSHKCTGDGVQEEFIQGKLEFSQHCQGQHVLWCFPVDWHPHLQSKGAHPPLLSAQEAPGSITSCLLFKGSLFSILTSISTLPRFDHFTVL